MELAEFEFLEKLWIPASNITKYDYIKVVSTQKEFLQVIELMKKIFPAHWKRYKKLGLEGFNSSENFLLGYFNEDGNLIGSARLEHYTSNNIIAISALQVYPNHQRKGIASFLFKVIKDIAKQYDCFYLYLIVDKDNKKARKLYRKSGFQKLPAIYEIRITDSIGHQNHKIIGKFDFIPIEYSKHLENVDSFFKKHYKEYKRVFSQFEKLKHLIKEQRVFGLFQDRKLVVLIAEYGKNNDVDIYLSSLIEHKIYYLLEVIKRMHLDIDKRKKIRILCDLDKNCLKKFKEYNISVIPNKIKIFLFYILRY